MPVTAVRDEGALRMWVCRLPVHIDHAERAVFYETLRRIRDFPMGQQSRRPLQQHCSSCRGRTTLSARRIYRFYGNPRRIRNFPPGRCGHRPLQPNAQVQSNSPKSFVKQLLSAGQSRALPLPRLRRIRTAIQVSNAGRFYRSYSNVTAHEFGCTITDGAHHSARRVRMCVRND